MKTFQLCFAAVVALAGCHRDTTVVWQIDGESERLFDGKLVVGERADVSIYVNHPEIEGSTRPAAIEVTTDNPGVAFAKPGGHGFHLFGVAPGTANLHVRTDTRLDGDFVVTVERPR